ncbi:MAG TPA: CBS domain-containing protein [Planctomycetota bacterium]|nr:CBS domain-containing protein [Planctomycetota bacterium]
MTTLTIGSVMTPAPLTVSEDDSLDLARKLMVRHRIHHVPVVRGREVVGMLTDRDLHLISYLANDLLREADLVAGDACVPDPYTVPPETPLEKVLRDMGERRIGSALVVRSGRLVGIFTAHDACTQLAHMLGAMTVFE